MYVYLVALEVANFMTDAFQPTNHEMFADHHIFLFLLQIQSFTPAYGATTLLAISFPINASTDDEAVLVFAHK